MRDNAPSGTDLATTPEIDWAAVARAALANGASNGMRRLNRKELTQLCGQLADGIPLETACRLQGLQPQHVRAWSESRPTAWRAIERARAFGERETIQVIKAATDWKAAAYRLGLQRPEYREGGAQQNLIGPAIQVTINVPIPQSVAPGERPAIDITPQCTPLSEK